MALYLIGYDLIGKPEQNYEELFKAIRLLDKDAVHELDSTWLVNSKASAGEVRNILKSHLGEKDKIVVIEITIPADWGTFRTPQITAKLQANV
jgi:hypothetical protein